MPSLNMTNLKVSEIRIPVPWGHIAAKCWGNSHNKPVLLLHGIQDNAGSFDRLVPILPAEYYYICLDLPGHGFSSHFQPGIPLEFMNYVGVVQRVSHFFGWKSLTLIGHSMGGIIASFFAASFVREVEKLVLLDMVSTIPLLKEVYLVAHRNKTNQLLNRESRITSETPVYTYEEALHVVTNQRLFGLTKEAAIPILNRSLRKVANGYQFTNDCKAKYDLRPPVDDATLLHIFGTIRCPVLVILGKNSELNYGYDTPGFFMDVLRIYEHSNPSSRIIRVDGNHVVHNNFPERVAPFISQFLSHEKCKY